MSSTRRQSANGPLRQERYASSPEFERGLNGNMVARRCSVIESAADRELIWWLHFMSHRAGGLKALVTGLITDCADRITDRADYDPSDNTESCLGEFLQSLCLNPSIGLESPWYFRELVPALRELMANWTSARQRSTVVTSLGKKVYDVLNYTEHSKTMTLVEGAARTGKSFAAEAWCEQRAGRARIIEVPTGNAERDFFLALARGLGLGSFTQYKAGEIRERVESALLSGDLLLCLDEAHRLWPEVNPRYGFPKRINWLMSLANKRVPICMIATPQFIERQKAVEQSGWNSSQFIGRLGYYEPLPHELSLEDLIAVASSVLPEADAKTKRALAAYARTSAKYLAAIEAIAKRASYIATKASRTTVTAQDVRLAMNESVIPADSKLVSALAPATRHKPKLKHESATSFHRAATEPQLPERNRIDTLLEAAGKE
ncbi:MAG TPA: AAA family ATPase [Verrucomicrobiae bacterium]|nr:AAA family ATPase [Verrucomicrobiae bacterium]